MNEIFNDEDDEIPLVEIYKYFFAKNAKKKIRLRLIRIKEKKSHNRPGLYSEIWIDLYTEYDFFLHILCTIIY